MDRVEDMDLSRFDGVQYADAKQAGEDGCVSHDDPLHGVWQAIKTHPNPPIDIGVAVKLASDVQHDMSRPVGVREFARMIGQSLAMMSEA